MPTALLQAIADKLIPGLGKSLRILLVRQIEDGLQVAESEDESVLQHVVKGDKERMKAMDEFQGQPPSFEVTRDSHITLQLSRELWNPSRSLRPTILSQKSVLLDGVSSWRRLRRLLCEPLAQEGRKRELMRSKPRRGSKKQKNCRLKFSVEARINCSRIGQYITAQGG